MSAPLLLGAEAARSYRADLKGALTSLVNGHGRIEALLHEIERIARDVSSNPSITLKRAANPMRTFVRCHAPAWLDETGLPGIDWDNLYKGVVAARNDIAHTGTQAALAGTRITALATVLLAVLAEAAKGEDVRAVKEVMVSNPICAETWQTLADLRRTMLVNDYSALPIRDGQAGDAGWKCVRAEELAAYVLVEKGGLGRRLGDVLAGKAFLVMDPYTARTVREDDRVDHLLDDKDRLPVVVTRAVDGREQIVGIVTAFDLL